MMTIQQLTKRATFNRPIKNRDQDGKIVQAMESAATVWANVRPLRGGEAVMQARLQSRSPAVITIRRSPDTLRITSEWEAVIDGRTFELREDPREDESRQFLEMLAEARS